MEGETNLNIGKTALDIHEIADVRMPVKDNINAVEAAFTGHISLSAATLFSWTAEQFHCALTTLGEPFRDGNSSCDRTCSKKIMSATVTRRTRLDGLFVCDCILRHAWQSVILRKNADDRTTAAI